MCNSILSGRTLRAYTNGLGRLSAALAPIAAKSASEGAASGMGRLGCLDTNRTRCEGEGRLIPSPAGLFIFAGLLQSITNDQSEAGTGGGCAQGGAVVDPANPIHVPFDRPDNRPGTPDYRCPVCGGPTYWDADEYGGVDACENDECESHAMEATR